MKKNLLKIYIKYLNFCEFWINTLHLSILATFLKFEKKNQLVTRIFVCCLFNYLILCKALKRHSEVQVHGFSQSLQFNLELEKKKTEHKRNVYYSRVAILLSLFDNFDVQIYLMEPFHSEDIHSIMVIFITRNTLFN